MKKTQNIDSDLRTRIARGFLTAYTANQLGVTFRTAEGYITGDNIGELWYLLADIALESLNKGFDAAVYAKNIKEKKAKPGKVIPFKRED